MMLLAVNKNAIDGNIDLYAVIDYRNFTHMSDRTTIEYIHRAALEYRMK